MTLQRLDAGTALVDLRHQGRPAVIGTGVIESPEGIGLVDPGPTVCLPALEEGLAAMGHELRDVRAVLLTHIHLDHATAAGALVRAVPEALVYVHPRGAPHMIDPSRLLASATRIYGDAMQTLWGEFLPVPPESVREVDEGARVSFGGRELDVAYVPGHAKHHVAYFESATGTAWVGDVGGVRLPGGVPLPVTPPPDIDVEAWQKSMARVLSWAPARIIPTHFGPIDDPEAHFAELDRRLVEWAEWVRESLVGVAVDGDPDDPARADRFAEWVRQGLAAEVSEELIDAYHFASGFRDSWWGLARYWRKRA